MPTLSDFVVVGGEDVVSIGDKNPSWQEEFWTGDRRSSGLVFLMITVKGMTWAKKSAEVKINDKSVGHITPNRWPTKDLKKEAAEHWVTQTITFKASDLKDDSKNSITIKAVKYPGGSGSDIYDDFSIKNVICFFHQRA